MNYILKWNFFVRTILADRFIHRTEMRVVSLKSLSSVEFKTKKIFLNFVFFEDLSRIEVLCEHNDNLTYCLVKTNGQKIRFQRIARAFFGFDSEFS